MLYNYKGTKIEASSKVEAIDKIIAGDSAWTKEQLINVVNLIRDDILNNIQGISKSIVKKSMEEFIQLDVITNKIGKKAIPFTIYVENNHNVVINFTEFDPEGKDREFTFRVKSIKDANFNKVTDCIVAIINGYAKYENDSMKYDSYKAILNKWDNR